MRRMGWFLVLVMVVASVPLGGDPAHAAGTCFGRPITIHATPGVRTIGTNGNDVIKGTPGDDFIQGGKGHDRICGAGGNDELRGGPGRDRIDGGSGDDLLEGGRSNDRLIGGRGADILQISAGMDVLIGKAGRDTFDGSAARQRTVPVDWQVGDPDGLIIWAESRFFGPWVYGEGTLSSIEVVVGTRWDDLIGTGGGVPRTVYAGDGSDEIRVGFQGNRIFGEAGNDTIDSRAAFATLRGGSGRDRIWSGYRNDINGGPGRDLCSLNMDVAPAGCELLELQCGAGGGSLPAGATDLTTASGYFDGTRGGKLQVYKDAGQWWIRLESTRGGGVFGGTRPLPTPLAQAARALGGHDIDGDGIEEAFVVIGQGAASETVGIYTLWQPFGSPALGFSCGVSPVTYAAAPTFDAAFPIGATVLVQSGLECRGNHTLREYVQDSPDGINYNQQRIDYVYDAGFADTGPLLTQIRDTMVLLSRPGNNSLINRAGDFTCGNLNL